MTFAEMKNVDIRAALPENLVEVSTVVIDPALTMKERLLDNARQLGGNPFIFKCRDVIVKISHADTTVSLTDRMITHMQTL
jgi:hypothetical protein